jgi:hypothetical protein
MLESIKTNKSVERDKIMCCHQFSLICQQERHVSAYRHHHVWYKSNVKLKEDKMLINWKYNNINVSSSSLFGIPYKALQLY